MSSAHGKVIENSKTKPSRTAVAFQHAKIKSNKSVIWYTDWRDAFFIAYSVLISCSIYIEKQNPYMLNRYTQPHNNAQMAGC